MHSASTHPLLPGRANLQGAANNQLSLCLRISSRKANDTTNSCDVGHGFILLVLSTKDYFNNFHLHPFIPTVLRGRMMERRSRLKQTKILYQKKGFLFTFNFYDYYTSLNKMRRLTGMCFYTKESKDQPWLWLTTFFFQCYSPFSSFLFAFEEGLCL